MSSTIFFHNPQELNWKLWGLAFLAATVTVSISFGNLQKSGSAFLNTMSKQGVYAESIGHYRQARQDFDLALLKARASNDKKALITALINCSRIDNEFDEEKLARSLAKEAVQLSQKVYGNNSPMTAEATLALAECLSDNDAALAMYSSALKILQNQGYSDTKYDAQIAKTLLEMSICYDELELPNQAISACKASMHMFERLDATQNANYARALIQYATISGLPVDECADLLHKGLRIQSEVLGKQHPAIALTLSIMAAQETESKKKEDLLREAVRIDEAAFGNSSTRVVRDLLELSNVLKSDGHKREAQEIEDHAARICRDKSTAIDELSTEFLGAYSKLLHELKFEQEAAPIDALLKRRADAPLKLAFQHHSSTSETDDDSESNPEYWQRTEVIPIDGVEKFNTAKYDHIQLWYDKGVLKLDAFSEGALAWQKEFAQCPTGIVNAGADSNKLFINWRDGDGPVWHNDVYEIKADKIQRVGHQISDAYAQQIAQQLEDVLAGDSEALLNGAVESVPATYINVNFIADAIRKGEHKALDLYGQGDAAAAAERLGMVFDLTAKAIDSQKSETNLAPRPENWLDAWNYMQLPVGDYVGPLNDYGFFLQQSGCLKESISVFKLVISVAPERAVSYLNMADSCWDLDKKSDAQKFYLSYLALMKGGQSAAKIPARVSQRISVNMNNGSRRAKVNKVASPDSRDETRESRNASNLGQSPVIKL